MKHFCSSVALLALCIAASRAKADDLEFKYPTEDGMKSNSCRTLKSLAQALYDGEGNVLNLTRAFYPPRELGVNFLHVSYVFEDSDGDVDNCTVMYTWAKGGFMLLQPPSILQFTSLLFSHNINKNYHLYLRLPFVCRHLVTTNGSNCSCKGEDYNILDMLTHQVSTCNQCFKHSNGLLSVHVYNGW
jgi:hypothetical protein